MLLEEKIAVAAFCSFQVWWFCGRIFGLPEDPSGLCLTLLEHVFLFTIAAKEWEVALSLPKKHI